EPYAVKVARTVLRRAALGNRCRLSDNDVSHMLDAAFVTTISHGISSYRGDQYTLFTPNKSKSPHFLHRINLNLCTFYTQWVLLVMNISIQIYAYLGTIR
ncbi:hypothetical protein ACQKQB_16990, partial [Photobacterium sp. DNB22_13_2]